jgi:hypothetical protein
VSWKHNAMKHLAKSLTEPLGQSSASSPIGLSMSGGTNLLFTNWTKCGHREGLVLSSNGDTRAAHHP